MKILLAVDGSEASEKAVRFVSRMLGDRTHNGSSVTLLHVVESIPDYLWFRSRAEEGESAFREVVERWEAENKAAGEKLLSNQKQSLISAGVAESAVETKLVEKPGRPESKKVVAALAIIEEMKSAPYEVVCLGRRGITASAGSFLGSVAEKVLREAYGKTVWVVD